MISQSFEPGYARVAVLSMALLTMLLSWPQVAANDDLGAEVDKLFAPWNRTDVPGCAVGIIRNGKLIYSKGFGSANLEFDVPNAPTTIFEIGSASKSFTCACIALLMDQGAIDPDDDLRKFVPEMHAFDPPIRIRHMIQCHTGLWEPFHIMPLAGWDNLPVHSPYSESDVFTVLAGQKVLPFEPGREFHYGSGDYYLLGLIVKRVSGKSLAAFARENLFAPLGMTRTFYEEDPTRVVTGRAVGHYREVGVWHRWQVNAYLPGGGGVKSCIEDLYRWDQNFYDSQLPRGKFMGEFIREGTLLGNRYVLDADAYRKYAQKDVPNPPLGRYRGLKRIQFTGGVFGMSAAMSRFPDQRFTVICLSNNDELSPFRKTAEIADLYLADDLEPLSEKLAGDEPQEFISLPLAELENKTAAYRLLSERRIWKVAIQDGDLHVIDPLNKAWRLKPFSATRFRPVGDARFYASARFLFRRESPDQPYSMNLESNERGFHEVLEFRRVDLVDPSADQLAEYAGDYFSDELSANYRFAVREGGLWLRVGSRRWERLDPTVRDEFIPHVRTLHDNRIVTFQRDGEQHLRGFSIAFWRIGGVEFKKQE